MIRIFFTLFIVLSLEAKMINGVAVLVKNDPITLYEIEEQMQKEGMDQQKAVDFLIRKTLEEQEIKERRISVNSSEVYDDIKQMAAQNSMSTSQLYDAMLRVRGLSSEEFKEKIREKLLNQKLYDAIAFSKMNRPSEQDLEDYYQLHRDEFSYSETFSVILYSSASQAKLQEKIDNPMFYSPEVRSEPTVLEYAKLNPQLAKLLSATPVNNFTPIVPAPGNIFMSFLIQEKANETVLPLEKVKSQVNGAIMNERRMQVLNDYFARLKMNADIQMIRLDTNQ